MNQSGGVNAVSADLNLGFYAGSSGAYSLSGSGQLSAGSEYVGYNSAAAASFQQTGGTNTTSYLSIGAGGSTNCSGGTLQVNGSIVNQGVFDGGQQPGLAQTPRGIVDLASGTWKNLAACRSAWPPTRS